MRKRFAGTKALELDAKEKSLRKDILKA